MKHANIALALLFAILVGYAFGFSQTRHEYNALADQWNDYVGRTKAKQMLGTGNWHCGKMVVSCNEDGFLDMNGNMPELPAK